MKIKNLLFLGAMLLIGGTASAAIVDGVRQKPVPEKAAFNYGDTLYMYNVGAKMFWGGGNDWNTRASVVEEGVQVVFIKELVNGEWVETPIVMALGAKSNVLQYYTEGGLKISVRPSGTEPKIKFYFEIPAVMATPADYEAATAEAEAKVPAIKASLGI